MRSWRMIFWVGLFLVLWGQEAPTLRAAPPAAVDDIVHTVRARKLLYEDERLRSLNLGVCVVNRVAVLWGPVPTLDLGLRAESRLRTMIELRDVRNELHVVADLPFMLPDRVPARTNPRPPAAEPSRRKPPVPGRVPVELGEPRPETSARR